MGTTASVPVARSNADAAAAWNGDDGAHWVTYATTYDRSVAPYHRALLDAARIGANEHGVDIGCGSGQTTRDAARLAHAGEAVGIDLSVPLLALAGRLAAEEHLDNVRFVLADAQIHPFEPASFDVAISRTGAMFFGDRVAAFANIAGGLRPGGRLALLVWQHVERNEWFVDFRDAVLARRAAPAPPAGAPGPFSLADPDDVHRLLAGAGFETVELAAMSEPMWFGATAGEAYDFVRTLGFTRWMLRDLDAEARAGALVALRRTIDAHATSAGVVYASAAWVVTAVRSDALGTTATAPGPE
jgi:SAM-dependent methyltransferase